MPAFICNPGTLAGVYRTPAIHVDVTAVFTNTNPVRPYRGNGRPEAAYVIERMVDLAADELGIDPAELRRRNYIPPQPMPFKTGLTFTYDCGEFEKNMDLALELADIKGFEARAREARKRGKLRGFGISNTIERAARRRHRRRRNPLRPLRHGDACFPAPSPPGPGPRDRVQADGLRPARARSRRGALRAGRHRPGVLRRRHRRLALGDLGGSAFYAGGREDDRDQGASAIAAHMLKVDARRREFRRGRVLHAEDQPDA